MANYTKLGDAGKLGRGVFATRLIPPRRLLFKNPTWHLTKTDIKHIDKTSITGNYFMHPDIENDCLLVLGNLSLINHSSNPNSEINIVNTSLGYMVLCRSIHKIMPKEQIFIDYGSDHLFGNYD